MIQLGKLKLLYRSMRSQKIDRYKFEYLHGRVTFSVFFFIDESPFVLLFGAKEHNFSFELKVHRGFNVEPHLDNATYKQLCEALELRYDPDNPFSPSSFLTDFNHHIPPVAYPLHKAKPHEIIQYRRNVEEVDKIWFCGWRDNVIRNQSVTPENLNKTRVLLGERAFQRCRQKNISSCWTDDPARATEVILPPE